MLGEKCKLERCHHSTFVKYDLDSKHLTVVPSVKYQHMVMKYLPARYVIEYTVLTMHTCY